MARWQKFWIQITQPSEAIRDMDERQQASLFSGLLFIIIATLAIGIIIWVTISPLITRSILLSILGFFVFYLFCYSVSRSRYYRWAARVFIWVATIGSFLTFIYLDISVPERPLAYLSLSVIIAGLTLSLRETAITLLVIELALLILMSLYGDETYAIFHTPFLIALTGLLTIVSVIINNYYRRRALESEARYRELMNANTEGILVIAEEDARILDSNPAIEKILGYSREEVIGRYPIEFLKAESKALVRAAWDKRNKGIPVEAEAIHKDGSIVYIEAILKPYSYLNKEAYVLTVLDVSERKQVEALVIESEKRFRAIFNESSHFIGVLDVKGKMLEINEQGYEYFGLLPEETVGRYFWDMKQWAHSPASKERIRETVARASAGEIIRYHVEVRDRYNLPAWLDFTLKPVRDLDGTVTMLIADSRDITAYKIAEQQRVEYERRYEALFKSTTDAVLIVSLDGKLITVNDGALTMLGCTLDDITGVEISQYIVPEEFSETLNNMERLKAGEEFFNVYERRLRRKNGEVFSAELTKMMVYDADNKPMYIQTMAREITERKRMERQRLEMAIEKERSKLLQHFIEQASHHFRTPITNLKTSLYLLPRFLNNEQKRTEHMTVVNQELLRLQNLLEDLLSVLRLQKSDTEFSLSKIHMNQFMGEVRATQEGRDYYSRFQWQWELSDEDVLIIGDKGVLGRALLNLLENATTFTQEGGMITVRNYTSGLWQAIDIVDTGVGIHPNDLPHIFEDFYRSQDALAGEPSGSGLGLTISKSIIERHQGTIRVASSLGTGTHFQVLLPIYTEWTTTPPPLPEGFLASGD
jgi:PAS domain S-box-containing protein